MLIASRVSHSFNAGGAVAGNIATMMRGCSVHMVIEEVADTMTYSGEVGRGG